MANLRLLLQRTALGVPLALLVSACGDDGKSDDSPTTDASSDAVETDAGNDAGEVDAGDDDVEGDAEGDAEDGGGIPIPLPIPEGCNPVAYENDCLFPFPSDFFRVEDADAPGGYRIAIEGEGMPVTDEGIPVDFQALHPSDGFSHHPVIVAYFDEGVDPAGLVGPTEDLDQTILATNSTILLDTETGQAVPHFAELDESPEADGRRALMIRPIDRLDNGRRYIVALQGLSSPDGQSLEAPNGFLQLRDAGADGEPTLGSLVARYEADIFTPLEEFGIERAELQLAWDFTTQRLESATGDMLRVRELALADFEANPPVVTVVSVEDSFPDDSIEADHVDRIINGTIEVPLYMENADVGAILNRDESGQVVQNGRATFEFMVVVPNSALAEDAEPMRVVQFGHGFFGSRNEIRNGQSPRVADEYGWVLVGADWWGMSSPDQGPVIGAIDVDMREGYRFVDRVHQGMVNYLALAWAVQNVFESLPELQLEDGTPYIDTQELYFYGLSQGHILGATYFSLSDRIERGVLGVGGGSFTMVMTRASPFVTFTTFIRRELPDPLDLLKFITLSSTSLDRIDPLTYAPYVFDSPLPGAPPERRVLMNLGIGDTVFPNYGTHAHARSLGLPLLQPAPREVEFFSPIEVGEGQDVSAFMEVDMGIEPLPVENAFSRSPNCVHGRVRELDFVNEQLSAFWRPDGVVIHPCGEQPCASTCE